MCLDDIVNGMKNESESEVAFLLPTDPVNNNKKRGHDQISYVPTPRTASKSKGREKVKWKNKASIKPSIGNNGVELRYYKYDEFFALNQEKQDSNVNHKGVWSGKAPGSAKSNNGKVNYLTRAQVSSILKEHDDVKEKDANSKNEMVASMKEDIKGWISAYGTQLVPGYTVDSDKQLKPVKILVVTNSTVDQNATGAMSETSAKYLIDNFSRWAQIMAAERRQLLQTGHGYLPVEGIWPA